MQPFVTLPYAPALDTESERACVVADISENLKRFVGARITGTAAFIQSLTSVVETYVQATCPSAQAGKHFTVNIHPPKSRRKKRLGLVKIVIRPLPRSLRGIVYQPPVPVNYVEVTCTLPNNPLEAPIAE